MFKKAGQHIKRVLKRIGRLAGVGKRALTVTLAMTVITAALPVAELTASAATVTGNPAFKVIAYDTSARIDIPMISDATNYKVYYSTVKNADLAELNLDTAKQAIVDNGSYVPYAYVLNGDKNQTGGTIEISENATYYFYLVTNNGSADVLQSTFMATTRAAADCYWTSAGNYDSGWYAGHESDTNYTISTAAQLAGLAVLTNGLNGVPAVNFTGKTIKLSASVDLSANLWTPIGTSTIQYGGTFDGGNYNEAVLSSSNVVSGLHTNNSTNEYQGLFGYTGIDSMIENIGMTNGYIKGRINVGGVVGGADGAISNCYNTGLVSGTEDYIGGVVGYASGTVTSCYNTGTVSGMQAYIGGVAGEVDAAISNCYSTATVSGADYVGGVAGYANSTVTSCYSTGATSGTYYVGGVVGTACGAILSCCNTGAVNGTEGYIGGVVGTASDAIANCYNTGAVSGTDQVGGVAGEVHAAISNCYNAGAVSGTDSFIGGVAGAANDKLSYNYYCGYSGGVGQDGNTKASDVTNGTIPFASCKTPLETGEKANIAELPAETLNSDFKAAFGIIGIQYPGAYESSNSGIITVSGKEVTAIGSGTAFVNGVAGSNSNAGIIITQSALNMTDTSKGFKDAGTVKVSGKVILPITVEASTKNAITELSIGSNLGVIDETNHNIAVTVPYGTDVTALTATFTATGSSVKVGSTKQISGTTANNFTNPVTYTVTAANGTSQDYKVTVTVAASTNKLLQSITAPSNITNIANGAAKTAAALKLPATVTLVTSSGDVSAIVHWDVKSSSYDASKTTAQTFTVNGTVILPAGVDANGVSLSTSISVTVNAASGGDSGKVTITGFKPLDDKLKSYTVDNGVDFSSLNLTQKLEVVGKDVTGLFVKVTKWVCSTYDSTVAGVYKLTPVLDSGYVASGYVDSGFAVGCSLPQITVTVKAKSSSGNSNSNNTPSSPATTKQGTETKVDTANNTATVTTKPDSVNTNGNTASIETTVPSVTVDNTSTSTNGSTVDTSKKAAVTINVPTEAIVQQLIAKKDVDLTVTVPPEVAKDAVGSAVVTINANKEILEAAKENLTDVTIKIKDAGTQQLAYSWTFKGQDLAKSTVPVKDVNIAMSVHLTTEVQKVNVITPANKGLVLSFDHSGLLPSVASVKFSAREKGFQPGQTLYFYYYNPTTKQIELLGKDAYTVDVDGNVTVQIEYCSDYVLLPKAARTITLDTRTYTMSPKKSYEIGVKLTGVSNTTIKAYSSAKGVASVSVLKDGNVRATGAKPGLTYIMVDVYDSKNKFLTHASVRLTVQNGVKENGNSARQHGIF